MNGPAAVRYDATAVTLHWLLALLIAANLALGVWMAGLPFTPLRLRLFNLHKWAGITILALSALRLLWRLSHAPPPDLPMPAWQRRAAHAVHRLLYALFFALPLAGWAYSSAAGFPVVLFGVWPLPDFVPVSRPPAAALKTVHAGLAALLALAVLLHVAAALKHQWADRQALLQRMRWG